MKPLFILLVLLALATPAHAAPSTPAEVLSTAQQVIIGGQYTCALTAAGGVKCWGLIGNPTLFYQHIQSDVPVDVPGLTSDVQSIAMSDVHICALLTNGSVKCWGDGWFGQLGNGELGYSQVPTDVIGLSDVKSIAAHGTLSCAITQAGGVVCWGQDSCHSYSTTPTAIEGLSTGASSLILGSAHSCALMDTGGIRCWGNDDNGALGDSIPLDSCVGAPVATHVVGFVHYLSYQPLVFK